MLTLKKNYREAKRLELMPLAASSTDYNQSVHRTLNFENFKYFWSSKGSETSDAEEWLDYKIPILKQQ
jgi:hypothetical protein